MANPATLLADLLDLWRVPPGQTIQGLRSDHNPDSVEFWRLHGQAVRWLLELDRFISGMDALGTDAQMYADSFPAWYRAVFAIGFTWDNPLPNGIELADPRDVRILRGLGAHMETAGYAGPIGQSDELLAAISDADDLIRSSPIINNDTRRYLLGLVREASDTLAEVDSRGNVAARSVIFELGGAMTSIAGNLPDDKGEGTKWRDATRKIFARLAWMIVPYALDAGANAAGVLPQ